MEIKSSGFIEGEKKTLKVMIELNCRKNHRSPDRGNELCPDCSRLLSYAHSRLEKCPYGGKKPACSRCRIHCYREPERTEIKAAMRFAGPRMLFRHPLLALRHLRGLLRKMPDF